MNKEETNSNEFSNLIIQFSKNLELINDFVTLVEPLLQKEGQKQLKKEAETLWPWVVLLEKEINDNGIPKISPEKQKKLSQKTGITIKESKTEQGSFSITTNSKEASEKFKKANEIMFLSIRRSQFLYETLLMSLISSVEWFFSQLLHLHLSKNPSIVTENSDRNFSYSELSDFESIEDARSFLVERKVDEIIKGNFLEWISFTQNKIGLKTDRLDKFIDESYEVFLRRNLIVHNGGEINNTYLKKIPESIKKGNFKLGKKLVVSEQYLSKAITLLEIIFIDIASQIWARNIKTDTEIEKYFDILFSEISYPAITKEKYELAEHICSFLKENKKLSNQSRLYALMNFWQAMKWQDKFDEIKKEIEGYDLSANDKIFQLVKLALLEENKKFFDLLPHVLQPKGPLNIKDFKEWPIFKIQRKNKRKCGEIYKSFQKPKTKKKA